MRYCIKVVDCVKIKACMSFVQAYCMYMYILYVCVRTCSVRYCMNVLDRVLIDYWMSVVKFSTLYIM